MDYFYRDVVPGQLISLLDDQFLAEANRRHDADRHEVSMIVKAHFSQVDWSRFAAEPGRRGDSGFTLER